MLGRSQPSKTNKENGTDKSVNQQGWQTPYDTFSPCFITTYDTYLVYYDMIYIHGTDGEPRRDGPPNRVVRMEIACSVSMSLRVLVGD